MDKWNEQAAPNNNQKASDMAPGSEAASQMKMKGAPKEEINDMKTENDVRRQNF
jgi:hypothetical protein